MSETGKGYIPLNQRGGTPLSKGREPYTWQTPPTVAPKGAAASSGTNTIARLAAALADAERELALAKGRLMIDCTAKSRDHECRFNEHEGRKHQCCCGQEWLGGVKSTGDLDDTGIADAIMARLNREAGN